MARPKIKISTDADKEAPKKAPAKKTTTRTASKAAPKATPKAEPAPPVEVSLKTQDEISASDILQDIVQKSQDTGVKRIALEKIEYNKNNRYREKLKPESIERMAATLLRDGHLLHNVAGFYDEDRDKYVLTSGERRVRALNLLRERYENYTGDPEDENYKAYLDTMQKLVLEGVPFNVTSWTAPKTELEEVNLQIQVSSANEEAELPDQDRNQLIMEYEALLQRRNELLKADDKPIQNVNKAISEKYNITERQVIKHKNVGKKLIPELKQLFDEKKITLTDGNDFAGLSPEHQKEVFAAFEAGETITKETIAEMKALQNELKKKEKEYQEKIQNIESDKNELSTELSAKEDEIKALSEKLKTADNDRKKEIQAEIAKKTAALQETIDANEKIMSEKEQVVAELTQELESIKAEHKNKENSNTELLKNSVFLDSAFQDCVRQVERLKTALSNYKSSFNADEAKKLKLDSLDEWEKKISTLLAQEIK